MGISDIDVHALPGEEGRGRVDFAEHDAERAGVVALAGGRGKIGYHVDDDMLIGIEEDVGHERAVASVVVRARQRSVIVPCPDRVVVAVGGQDIGGEQIHGFVIRRDHRHQNRRQTKGEHEGDELFHDASPYIFWIFGISSPGMHISGYSIT